MKDYKNMTNEELKEEFIKWFGEEKWEEEEILEFIQEVVFNICSEYFNISPIPAVFEYVEGNISVFDNKLKCIKLNPKYKDDKVTLVAATVHELEHYYQLLYVSNCNTPKAKRWLKELNNYISGEKNPTGNVLQEVEIDAEAVTQVILETEYGIRYRNPDPNLQEIIDLYIKSGKILSNK